MLSKYNIVSWGKMRLETELCCLICTELETMLSEIYRDGDIEITSDGPKILLHWFLSQGAMVELAIILLEIDLPKPEKKKDDYETDPMDMMLNGKYSKDIARITFH